jgi:catechol 2,3-dioxygenase-like lactoylglutathione lyase family enzyme
MALLTWLSVPGSADDWRALGFTNFHGSTFAVGRVSIEPNHAPSWGFDELSADPRNFEVKTNTSSLVVPEAVVQPNGVDRVDHVVYTVPVLDDAVAALNEVLGEEPRRRFHPRGPEGPEMAFYRVGEAFIEVVSSGRPASLMGIAFSAPDLDATVEAIRAAGGPIGDPKPAVQGGRIASVWSGHVGWGVAIMEPPAR